MPISAGSSTRLAPGPSRLSPAYLVRFPEDVWSRIESASGSSDALSISLDDGIQLHLPSLDPITLKVQQNGAPSEIYALSSGSQECITPIAVADSRLIVPLSSANSSRAADKLRAQNEANDRKRKDRADRVNGTKAAAPPAIQALKEATSMARSVSSPVSSIHPQTSSNGPIVPLKTRVVQLLALGPISVNEIVSRVGMHESEVMRVVKVVGREAASGTYALQPSKYHQVKVAQWKYTYNEKLKVLQLAKEAFDELDLPPDADERAELDRKESDVLNGRRSSSSDEESKQPAPVSAVVPEVSKSPAKKKEKPGLSLIGKQKAKFAAEKRAASLPNVKKDVTASPRLAAEENPAVSLSPTKETKTLGKRKSTDEGNGNKPKKAGSPESDHETRGRSREPQKPVAPIARPLPSFKKKTRPSRDYSSSEEDTAAAKPTVSTRKAPPPELKLNGRRPETEPPPDPETLRERYEELFPAYELLSRRLAKLHQDAEAEEEGQVVEMDNVELSKLVARWEKWHAELARIRRWFAGP